MLKIIKQKRLNKNHTNDFLNLLNDVLTSDFPEYQLKTAQEYKKLYGKKWFKEEIKKKKNYFLGAFDKKTLIGVISFIGQPGGFGSVSWLFIDKKYRSQGVGISLLKKLEQWLTKNNFHGYFLYTESQKNIDFYTKRGFRHVGTMINSWFGVNEHIMEKILN